MAKYYLQSGQINFVVNAADAEGAALWAMHRVIDDMIQKYEQEQIPRLMDAELTDCDYEDGESQFDVEMFEPMLDGLALFDSEIKCSQAGFGREDAGTLDTSEIFVQWRQLMRAADKLFDGLK